MAEVMLDWYTILMCGGLAAVLGFSVLLCAMIVVMLLLECWLFAAAVIMRINCRCQVLTAVSVLEAIVLE